MFEFIRSHQRLMQLILLVLIVPSFALIGMSGYSTYVSGDHEIARVGDASVTQEEFDQARRNQLQQMQESSQGRFDPAMLDNPDARRALLDQLIDRRTQIVIAAKDRFSVSDGALRRAIAAIPQLQVDGQFSPERYNEVLASSGLTPRDFEMGQRAELALSRVLGPIGDTAGIPKSVLNRLEQALTEERTIRMRTFSPGDYQADIKVNDEDIKTWYDTHQDALRLPEQVAIQYILLDEASAIASVPTIDNEQLKGYYEQNKAKYVVPARVNVSHILIKLPSGATEETSKQAMEKAQAIVKRAREAGPSEFAALASKESQDAGTARSGGELGWVQRGIWPLNLEQAIFGLKKDEISDPIKGQDGYHIFMVNDIQAEKGETFDEAKPKVEEEVRRQLAADRFADMATKLTSLVYDNATSLEPAAQALGVDIRKATGISRDRVLSAEEAGPGSAAASPDATTLEDVRVRSVLFTPQLLTDKQNSGVIEISPDTMIAVRVDAVTPAHVPELALVSEHIHDRLLAERSLQAAVQAGEAVLSSLQTDPSKTPESFGEPVKVSRLNPLGLNKIVLDAAFRVPADKVPAYQGVTLPQGYAILGIDDVKAGTTDNPALEGLPIQLAQVWGSTEEQAVMQAMRAGLEVKITPEGEQLITQDPNRD